MTTNNNNSNINRAQVGISLEDLLNEAGIFEEVDKKARQVVERIRKEREATGVAGAVCGPLTGTERLGRV
jgi:hypothetical protein